MEIYKNTSAWPGNCRAVLSTSRPTPTGAGLPTIDNPTNTADPKGANRAKPLAGSLYVASEASSSGATDFNKVVSRCSFVRKGIEAPKAMTQADVQAILSNIVHCEDGPSHCHEILSNREDYDQGHVDALIEQAFERSGPLGCSHIANELGHEGCGGCDLAVFGASPLQLGSSRYDDELLIALEEMNLTNALVTVGNSVRILHETMDHEGKKVIKFLTREDFHLMYSNRIITVLGRKGPNEVFVSREWLRWPDRREFGSVVFAPGKEVPGHYNLYRGFSVKPKAGDWSLMKLHILENICSGDVRAYEYVLNLLARIVQVPGGTRPGVALVLKGEQGTGKGIFIRNFGELLKDHYLQITHSEQIVGKFNQHLMASIVVFVDEGWFAGDKSAEGRLKALITEPTQMIEGKGRDAITVDNHVNLFVASNNSWVVPAGENERRFFVLEVSSKCRQDHDFFQRLQDQMDNGGREAMLHDLLQRDLRGVNLRSFPRTSALSDQVLHSLDNVGRFWHDRLYQGRLTTFEKLSDVMDHGSDYIYEENWFEQMPTKYLHDEYERFCKQQGLKHPLGIDLFIKRLKAYCPELKAIRRRGTGSSRIAVQVIPSLDDCRRAFSDKLGAEIEWPADDTTET